MANVIVDKNKIDLLANAISAKSGEPLTLTLDEMVEAVDGIETGGGGITPTGNIDITSAGTTDVTNYATATVPLADPWVGFANNEFITENNQRKWHIRPLVEFSEGEQVGWMDTDKYGQYFTYNAIASGTSVTPTESSQTIGGSRYMMEGAVTVNAIPSNYVGSGITRRDSTDLTASGATVSVPSGYYENNASKAVASGSATPASSISGTSATVSTGTNTLTLSKTVSNTPQVTAGYVSSGTAGNSSVSLTASVTTQAAQTIYPSASDQTISSGRYLTGTQTIKGVTYSNLTAANIKNGVTVTIGDSADADRILSVTGTYSGGGGSSMNTQIWLGRAQRAATTYGATTATLTVAVTGTYTVTWTAWRSSGSGTMGTNLYVNGTAGTNYQTFTGTYGQNPQLTGQQYNAGDVLTIYAVSGSTSRSIYVSNLIIEQTG